MSNVGASPPFVSGWSFYFLKKTHDVNIYPLPEVTEKVSDIKRRIWMILNRIDKIGERIALLATTSSLLCIIIKYIAERDRFYREYLKRGVFEKFSNLRLKMGVPLIQVKLPKIIPPNKMEIFELFRGLNDA